MAGTQNIILVGGGGHCSSVIDVIELHGKYKIAGVIDKEDKTGTSIDGYPFIGTDDDLPKLVRKYKNVIITIGQIRTPVRRIELFHLLKQLNAVFPVIISPLAYVSKNSLIEEGTVVMHMAQVNANAAIGRNCIINSKALIEHDAKIGDHCHISTGAIINGGTIIGENSFVGSGAVCRDNIKVDPSSFIKANSLVK